MQPPSSVCRPAMEIDRQRIAAVRVIRGALLRKPKRPVVAGRLAARVGQFLARTTIVVIRPRHGRKRWRRRQSLRSQKLTAPGAGVAKFLRWTGGEGH